MVEVRMDILAVRLGHRRGYKLADQCLDVRGRQLLTADPAQASPRTDLHGDRETSKCFFSGGGGWSMFFFCQTEYYVIQSDKRWSAILCKFLPVV